jgi:hypothetical protein
MWRILINGTPKVIADLSGCDRRLPVNQLGLIHELLYGGSDAAHPMVILFLPLDLLTYINWSTLLIAS